VVAGPTAVGKTAIAIELAKALNTSIISADSRQCYREMNIGTAKPGREELAEVKHYFIDQFSIQDEITAADFERLALGYLDQVFAKSDFAVVCGGTGLYIKALTEGLDEMPATKDEIEEDVNRQYQEHGMDWLKEANEKEDPVFYEKAEKDNPARLLRALIFKRSTGKSILDYRSGERKQRPFKIVKVAINLPRETLYERINSRVDQMMQAGLLEEVKELFSSRHLKNLQTVGYVELFDHLEGKLSLEEAIDKIKQHTRNYAKRQLTWFRKDKEYHWLEADDPRIIDNIISFKNL
jgi:tRNA dimethylallyltransferase